MIGGDRFAARERTPVSAGDLRSSINHLNFMTIQRISVFAFLLLSACSIDQAEVDVVDATDGDEVLESFDLPTEIQFEGEDPELVCATGICCNIQLKAGPTGYQTWGDCVGVTAVAECVGHYLDCGTACYNGGDWCAVNPANTYNTCCGAV